MTQPAAQPLVPFTENVRAHYDLSNRFFFLFLDESKMYSCAYFKRDDMTLTEAQFAKLDLSLDKCDITPGMKVLDIGCGWGTSSRRAAEEYGANVTALTLSQNQYDYATQILERHPVASGSIDFRLQGWEEHEQPYDRIYSIAAFEAFRKERYAEFFGRCRRMLPADGKMLLHTIVWPDWDDLPTGRDRDEDHDAVLFYKFLHYEIFPGGQLVQPATIHRYVEGAGLTVTHEESLRLHYARTLDVWSAALERHKDEAVELKGQETYDKYMKYLTGCAHYFRTGHVDIMQFTLAPQ